MPFLATSKNPFLLEAMDLLSDITESTWYCLFHTYKIDMECIDPPKLGNFRDLVTTSIKLINGAISRV